MVATVMDLELKLVSFMTVLDLGLDHKKRFGFPKMGFEKKKPFLRRPNTTSKRENVDSAPCTTAEKRTFLFARAHNYQSEISYYNSYR